MKRSKLFSLMLPLLIGLMAVQCSGSSVESKIKDRVEAQNKAYPVKLDATTTLEKASYAEPNIMEFHFSIHNDKAFPDTLQVKQLLVKNIKREMKLDGTEETFKGMDVVFRYVYNYKRTNGDEEYAFKLDIPFNGSNKN